MSERHPSVGSRRLIGAFGNSGTGKTQTLRAVMREWSRRMSFDKSAELLQDIDVQFVATTRGEVLDYLSDVKDEDDFSLAYQPVIEAETDHEALKAEAAECGFLARLALAAGNCLFTVDEAARCCRVNYVEYSTVALALEGRKRDVSGFYAGQRPVHIHPDIRAEVYGSEVYLFRLEDVNDREDIRARHGKEFADEIKDLINLRGFRISRNEIGRRRIENVVVLPDSRNPTIMLSDFGEPSDDGE